MSQRHPTSSQLNKLQNKWPELVEPALLSLALLFNGLGALSLHVQGANFTPLERSPLAAFAVFTCAVVGLWVWLNRVAPGRDPLLLPAAVLLSGWGLLTLARVAPNFLLRQVAWLCAGLLMCGVVAGARHQLRWLYRFKYTWLLLAFGLLLATLVFGVNPAGTGARLWLSIGTLFLQPSEILRLFVIAFLAAFLAERLDLGRPIIASGQTTSPLQALLVAIQKLAPSLLMWLIAVLLLFSQQDLGAAVLLLGTFITMLYLATGRKRLPLGGLVVLLLAGVAGYFISARVAQRIDIWLNPWADAQDTSFQIVQSLIAVASGNVFGQGLGQGRPGYVPAVHTDFPFAAIGEEFGLIGMLTCIAALGALALRGWRISQHASSAYVQLLAGGISAALTLQAFVIIGGNLAVLPLTGVTLPFISYGGSSLLVSFISLGLLIHMSAVASAAQATQSVQAKSALRGKSPTFPMRPNPPSRTLSRRAGHNLTRLSATLFAVLGLASAHWSVLQAPRLVTRPDNPRRVEAERTIARGPILSRAGAPLAYSLASIPTNAELKQAGLREPTQFVRTYPDTSAVGALGYYSERYGTSGLEAFADTQLRGPRTALDRLLHRPQMGSPVYTVIDQTLQHGLAQALHGRKGGAIAVNWRTGEVLALVSAPSFDPNRLDEDWEQLRQDKNAPLINRVTQGLYQPGTLLPALYADLQAPPSPLSNTIPLTGFNQLRALKLHLTVTFELDNATTPFPQAATVSETLGQGSLRVTPLRVAATCAALLAGRPIPLSLLASVPTTAHLNPPTTYTNTNIHACHHHLGYADVGVGQRAVWLVSAHATQPWLLVLVIEQPAAVARWPDAAEHIAHSNGFR